MVKEEVLCPSAPPDWGNARAIGVVGGTAYQPRVTPLELSVPVTAELLALAQPISPTEVFRFAATCQTEACPHFKGGSCFLAEKVVQLLPRVAERLPFCTIRPSCRWFR